MLTVGSKQKHSKEVLKEMSHFVDRLYTAADRPPKYLAGAVSRRELDILLREYIKKAPERSIEWGLGSGISAAAIGKARQLLGLSEKHTVLDPFQMECSGNWGLRCLEEFDVLDAVEFLPVFSEEHLIAVRQAQRQFDFIFIDGAHDTGHKIMDAYLALEVLAPKGVLCFHDSFFVSTSKAIQYLASDCSLKLLDIEGEGRIRRCLRSVKHSHRLGLRFAVRCAPKIHYSLSVLGR